MFVTFEGGEGAGKTTLIDKIYELLLTRGVRVVKTRAPGGTKVGEAIRAILLKKKGEIEIAARAELLLFLADRAQHVEEVILPAIRQGQLVLCDRFNDSTIAYQGARGFEEKMLRTFCNFASGDLQPDLTLYLDLDPKLGLQRVQKAGNGKDRIEAEDLSFHTKIREIYHALAKREPKRLHILDASISPDDVFRRAMQLIDAVLCAKR
jgi:dTMP kinase